MNENDIIFEQYVKKEQIKGGKADGKGCKDIAKRHNVPVEKIEKEVKIGIKIEMEHTKDKDIATEIAHDHLWEFPNYYTELEKMEERLKKQWKK